MVAFGANETISYVSASVTVSVRMPTVMTTRREPESPRGCLQRRAVFEDHSDASQDEAPMRAESEYCTFPRLLAARDTFESPRVGAFAGKIAEIDGKS
jgi:hypothetical protein